MPRVVHFELCAEQPERARKFYSDVFGWEMTKWDGPQEYWLISTGDSDKPGINGGGFTPVSEEDKFRSTVITMEVDSVDDYVAKVTANGGTIVVPKMAIPGVGWLAYFKDTEGVIVGMMQTDHAAQ